MGVRTSGGHVAEYGSSLLGRSRSLRFGPLDRPRALESRSHHRTRATGRRRRSPADDLLRQVRFGVCQHHRAREPRRGHSTRSTLRLPGAKRPILQVTRKTGSPSPGGAGRTELRCASAWRSRRLPLVPPRSDAASTLAFDDDLLKAGRPPIPTPATPGRRCPRATNAGKRWRTSAPRRHRSGELGARAERAHTRRRSRTDRAAAHTRDPSGGNACAEPTR